MFARDRLHGREGRGDGQTKRIIPSPIAAPPLFSYFYFSHIMYVPVDLLTASDSILQLQLYILMYM